MQERRTELSVHVQRVKTKTRPWKSIIALLLAIAAGIISHAARQHESTTFPTTSQLTNQIVWGSTAFLFLVFGSIATYGLGGQARNLFLPRLGPAHAAVVRYAILVVGGFTTLVITLLLYGVPVGQLLISGALASVFIGIAAQQALGNVFAGMVLLIARPFRVGQAVRLQAGALGGRLDGIVNDIGITYVRFDTGGTILSIPNSQVLNAMVGPVPPNENDHGQVPAVSEGKSGTPGGPQQPQPGPPGPG